jgi:hypothetical protein
VTGPALTSSTSIPRAEDAGLDRDAERTQLLDSPPCAAGSTSSWSRARKSRPESATLEDWRLEEDSWLVSPHGSRRPDPSMSEHWVTVVAAVLGLLGGMAGAAVGGYIANRGEQQRFEHERAAEIRDLRLDTYVMLLRAAELEHAQPVETDDRVVRTAEAEVALVAPTMAIREAAARFAENALHATSEHEYTRLRDEFIELAQAEIEPGA